MTIDVNINAFLYWSSVTWFVAMQTSTVHKCPLYDHSFVPRLLDGLHPFIALILLLGPQLQRLLSIVAKYNEEVVLSRQREKRDKVFTFVTLRPNTATSLLVSCTNSLILLKMLLVAPLRCWPQLIRHMAQTYGCIAFKCICFSHIFLAQIYLILTSREPYMRQAEHTDIESETGWGGST